MKLPWMKDLFFFNADNAEYHLKGLDTDPDLWWSCAIDYPALVHRQLPLFGLMVLGYPERWALIHNEPLLIKSFLRNDCQLLSPREQAGFVADCAEFLWQDTVRDHCVDADIKEARIQSVERAIALRRHTENRAQYLGYEDVAVVRALVSFFDLRSTHRTQSIHDFMEGLGQYWEPAQAVIQMTRTIECLQQHQERLDALLVGRI